MAHDLLPPSLGGGGSGDDDTIINKTINRVTEVNVPDWIKDNNALQTLSNIGSQGGRILQKIASAPKGAGAVLATLGGAILDPESIPSAGSLGQQAAAGFGNLTPEVIVQVLVGFAKDPFAFIWNLLVRKLLLFATRLVLVVASFVIDSLLYLLVGGNLTLEESGALGLSDLVFVILVGLSRPAIIAIETYTDAVVIVARTAVPQGTVWSGVAATVIIGGELIVTGVLAYRLALAVLDAVPGLSGVQTFLTGGS